MAINKNKVMNNLLFLQGSDMTFGVILTIVINGAFIVAIGKALYKLVTEMIDHHASNENFSDMIIRLLMNALSIIILCGLYGLSMFFLLDKYL